jgi:hypothetical protein
MDEVILLRSCLQQLGDLTGASNEVVVGVLGQAHGALDALSTKLVDFTFHTKTAQALALATNYASFRSEKQLATVQVRCDHLLHTTPCIHTTVEENRNEGGRGGRRSNRRGHALRALTARTGRRPGA